MKENSPGISSLITYRGFDDMFIGLIFFNQVIFGGGFPVAAHERRVLWPISTTLLLIGDCVTSGNPGGSLFTVIEENYELLWFRENIVKFL